MNSLIVKLAERCCLSYVLTHILGEREIHKTEMIIKIISLLFFSVNKEYQTCIVKGSRDFTQLKSVSHVVSVLKCN